MKKLVFIMLLIMLLFVSLGCASSDESEELEGLVRFEGTVIGKSDSNFLFIEEYVELKKELSVSEAYETYDGTLYSFSYENHKLAEIVIGDKVIVEARDEFLDTEPISGTAESVEVIN